MPKVNKFQSRVPYYHNLISKVERSIDTMKDKLLCNMDKFELTDDYEEVLAKMNYAVDHDISAFNSDPHKTVDLLYNGQQIPIDEKIAPLVTEIWKAGLNTRNSCESNTTNYIWIHFASVKDFDKFIGIIFAQGDLKNQDFQPCLDRMINHTCASHFDRWSIELLLDDVGFVNQTKDDGSISSIVDIKISITVSLRFPPKDYQYIYNRLVEYNKNTKLE